jgi:hypothetical protein
MATRVLFSKIPLCLCFYQRLDLFILGITATIANILNSIWWPTLLRFVGHCESQGMTLLEAVVNIQNKDFRPEIPYVCRDIEGYEQGRADVYSSLNSSVDSAADSSAIDCSLINSSINF